jgi:hypothetical protein
MKDMQFTIVPGKQPGEYVETMIPLQIEASDVDQVKAIMREACRVHWNLGAWTPATKEQMQRVAAAIVAEYDKEEKL